MHAYDPNTGQPDLLVKFLLKNTSSVLAIRHPFHYSQRIESMVEAFNQGRLTMKRRSTSLPRNEYLLYARDLLLTLYVVFSERRKYNIYIGVDPLNAFGGLVLRKLGMVQKVVLYTIDLPWKRFRNPLLNSMYHILDLFCATRCDLIWDLSPRMALLRRAYHWRPRNNNVRVVSSVYPLKARSVTRGPKISRLLFVGHLKESQGLQLAIESMPHILKSIPNAKLIIVGTGPYEPRLKEQVQTGNLSDVVTFLGQIADDTEVEKILVEGGVGIAPYVPDLQGITRYADPMKPKVYLACGLPVVMTDVPWFAKVVRESKAGIVTEYDKDQFVDAVVAIIGSDNDYNVYRNNALKLAQRFTPELVFGVAFRELVAEPKVYS